MKVLLIEFVDEAEKLLKSYGRDFFLSADTRVICLHPKVRAFLKKEGIDAFDTVNYLDNDVQHRIILKTEELTTALLLDIDIRDGFGIEKGYYETNFYYLRSYITHLLWLVEILRNVRIKHNPKEIHCCIVINEKAMYGKDAYIEDQERFLGLITRDFCRINNLEFHGLAMETSLSSNVFEIIATWCAGVLAKIVSFITSFVLFSAKNPSDQFVIVPAISYRMDSLLFEIKETQPQAKCVMIWKGGRTLKAELFKVYYILKNVVGKFKNKSVLDFVVPIDSLQMRVKKNKKKQDEINRQFLGLKGKLTDKAQKMLFYEDLFLGDYLANKVDTGLRNEILCLQHLTEVLARIYKSVKPQLIMSMYSLGLYHVMGDLSRVVGCRSLNISHGTHVPPNNKFEKIENYRLSLSVITNTFEYVAVQTPWTEKFLNYYQDKRPRVLSGPLLFSVKDQKVVEGVKKDLLKEFDCQKIMVHASTQKDRSNMRFHIAETLDEYVSTLRDLVNAVNALEDVLFVIRPHPCCDLSQDEFRLLLPDSKRVKIIDQGSFQKVLSVADLMVSYSSTCIEEALQNNIPVLLYDKWDRYNHFNLEESKEFVSLVKKPAYYVAREEYLTLGVRKILNIFDKEVLSDYDLETFKYPKDFRENYKKFVQQCFTPCASFLLCVIARSLKVFM